MSTSRLDRLLRPRSVAIVGVSPEPGHMGGSVLANLQRCGFAGAIHLVSRSRPEIGGQRCVPSIDDLPDGVDAAVLVVPQSAVLDAIAACGRRGVGAAVVFASGYAACFIGAMKFVASQGGPGQVPADASVTTTVGIGPRSEGGFGLDVDMEVSLPGVAKADAEALVEKAHHICPYSNAIRGNVSVRTKVV